MANRPSAVVANFPATASSVVIASSGVGVLAGWSLRESTGTASATVTLWDNASAASGTHYGVITLNAGESIRDWFGDLTLANLTGGLYLQVVSGSVQGAVFYL